jgi:hypothetical protein
MKTTTKLLIVAISAVGLLATTDVASAAAHHKAAHHKTMAKCAAAPGSLNALMCPQAPAPKAKKT